MIIFWDHLKNEDRLKNGDDLKNEDDLTNEVDSKVVLPKDGRSFQSSQCVDQICFSQHYSINIRLETSEIKILSGAVLSQAKKSECGMAQPSSCIARFNVLNKWYVRTTAKIQGLIHYPMKHLENWIQNEKKRKKTFYNVLALRNLCWQFFFFFIRFNGCSL